MQSGSLFVLGRSTSTIETVGRAVANTQIGLSAETLLPPIRSVTVEWIQLAHIQPRFERYSQGPTTEFGSVRAPPFGAIAL